jgi:flap endonuclease-1
MGVDLSELVPKEFRTIPDFSGQTAAVDAYNAIYQFLSIIRQPDGTPLMDSCKRTTSHLSGLFYRNVNLLEAGIRPVYVFDGAPHPLKRGTIDGRIAIKEKAQLEYISALAEGDMEKARSKAQQTSRLTRDMVEDSKRLLAMMGIPVVQALSDGEAQACHMVIRGAASFVASQDFDSLLFGAPVLVRNLTVSGRRKLPRKQIYVNVEPERMELARALSALLLTREQLVEMCILMGTDFNEGIMGIGPKKALKLIRENGDLASVMAKKSFEIPHWEEVRSIFLSPAVEEPVPVTFESPDVKKVVDFLCGEHDFSRERVEAPLQRLTGVLEEQEKQKAQSSLDKWF